jgi:hypothetical protein
MPEKCTCYRGDSDWGGSQWEWRCNRPYNVVGQTVWVGPLGTQEAQNYLSSVPNSSSSNSTKLKSHNWNCTLSITAHAWNQPHNLRIQFIIKQQAIFTFWWFPHYDVSWTQRTLHTVLLSSGGSLQYLAPTNMARSSTPNSVSPTATAVNTNWNSRLLMLNHKHSGNYILYVHNIKQSYTATDMYWHTKL